MERRDTETTTIDTKFEIRLFIPSTTSPSIDLKRSSGDFSKIENQGNRSIETG